MVIKTDDFELVDANNKLELEEDSLLLDSKDFEAEEPELEQDEEYLHLMELSEELGVRI